MRVSPIRGWALLFSKGLLLVGLTPTSPEKVLASTPTTIVTLPPGAADAVQEATPRPVEPTPNIPPSPPSQPLLQTPAPEVETPPPQPELRFPVRQIQVEGSTVLQDEIAELVQEYQSRSELSLNELLELRSQITRLYIENGYITSGAFLPSGQTLQDGQVRIQVVEGRLEAINLCLLSPGANRAERTQSRTQGETPEETSAEPTTAPSESPVSEPPASEPLACGSAHLREGYVQSRLAALMDEPVQQQQIETALQLLQINPLIQQVNANLTAGSVPGLNVLEVRVREAPALRVGIGTDNYQSPSIGSEQFSIQASYENLLGWGDRVSASYGITEGLDSFSVGYAVPLNPKDGTLSFSYSNDDSRIVEAEFEDLDIRSQSETFSLGFRQPIVKTPNQEFALSAGLDLRRSTSFLDGEPFAFSLGPDEDGRSRVTVVRLAQDWVNRDIDTVLAARSQFSIGIDAFDATINDTGTDGRFFAWIGQFQWLEQVAPRFVLVSRLNAQLTPDSLLSLERFGFGGADTVRGYRQNQLVTDSGILGATELRFSVLPNSNRLQLIPFLEAGYGWNNDTPDPADPLLLSLGLGLRWAITPDLSVRLDYGVPLIDVEDEGNSLQDNGFYFSLRYQPF